MYQMEKRVMRGEVYYVRYDRGVGSEMGYGRPVVVVSSDEGNNRAPTINVVPLTTTPKTGSIFVELHTPHKQSWAVCNQIFTYDKIRLADYMCILSDEEMEAIDNVLLTVLDLKQKEVEYNDENDSDELVCDNYDLSDEYDKIVELTAERDLYKRLYEKVLEKLADTELDNKKKPVVVEAKNPVVEKSVVYNKVNVNTATEEEISRISGMGTQTAHRIVCYRKKHGKFKALEDLLNVDRFGMGCWELYADKLMV